MNNPGMTEVLYSIILVIISIAISKFWKIEVEKDIAIGSLRSFIQLVAVGYALNFIFDLQSIWMIIVALMIMILVGAQAASSKVKVIKTPFLLISIAMLFGSFITIGMMASLKIIVFEARYIIPLGGMIIGNSMNAAALSVNRITSDIISNKLAVETSLSLGKSWRISSSKYIRAAVTTGMISILNSMKTVGLVALPGAMTGMILAGADPLDAVLLQIIVMNMLLFACAITSVFVVELTVRQLFTINHQLKIAE